MCDEGLFEHSNIILSSSKKECTWQKFFQSCPIFTLFAGKGFYETLHWTSLISPWRTFFFNLTLQMYLAKSSGRYFKKIKQCVNNLIYKIRIEILNKTKVKCHQIT